MSLLPVYALFHIFMVFPDEPLSTNPYALMPTAKVTLLPKY